MLQALPSIAANIENYRQRTQYGQVGFFELGGNDSPLEFDVPNVDEFPKAELLKMEKEMTVFTFQVTLWINIPTL